MQEKKIEHQDRRKLVEFRKFCGVLRVYSSNKQIISILGSKEGDDVNLILVDFNNEFLRISYADMWEFGDFGGYGLEQNSISRWAICDQNLIIHPTVLCWRDEGAIFHSREFRGSC